MYSGTFSFNPIGLKENVIFLKFIISLQLIIFTFLIGFPLTKTAEMEFQNFQKATAKMAT